METVFKGEQVHLLSKRLGISQKDVKKVIDTYVSRLLKKVEKGETVKFLNICYLRPVDNIGNTYMESLAYVSTEIGKEVKLSREVVYRVLSELANFICEDLKKFYSYTIRGIVNISLEEYKSGIYKVRVRKSKNLKDLNVGISTINSFKRKVENNDR